MSGIKDLLRPLATLTAPIGSVTAVTGADRSVVLTYDDGPHPVNTPAVLDALAETGATATFFVLLTRVRQEPGVVRETIAAGHEIALHGSDHRAMTTLPPAEATRRLVDGRKELEDVTGRAVRWFRPPYGRQNAHTWRETRRAGLTPVMWGPSLADSRTDLDDDGRIAFALSKTVAGSILLCHDNFADATDGADDGTAPDLDRARLARRLIAALAERDLRCLSLADVLAAGASPSKRSWFSS